MPIDKIVLLGDSYCADAKYFHRDNEEEINERYNTDGVGFLPFFWPSVTWIDHLQERTGLEIIGKGYSGHGPTITIDALDYHIKNYDISTTYFIICWSDVSRTVVKPPLAVASKPADPDREIFLLDSELVTEIDSPGPDAPMVEEISTLGGENLGWANALKLWHLYLKNSVDEERRWRTIKLAFKQLITENNITNYQEYYCFKPLATLEEDSKPLDFIHEGNVYTNLYEFAQSQDDYGVQGVDDLNYPNHMSPKGSQEFANIVYQRMQHLL